MKVKIREKAKYFRIHPWC